VTSGKVEARVANVLLTEVVVTSGTLTFGDLKLVED
jgi:hypothetical protein